MIHPKIIAKQYEKPATPLLKSAFARLSATQNDNLRYVNIINM